MILIKYCLLSISCILLMSSVACLCIGAIDQSIILFKLFLISILND